MITGPAAWALGGRASLQALRVYDGLCATFVGQQDESPAGPGSHNVAQAPRLRRASLACDQVSHTRRPHPGRVCHVVQCADHSFEVTPRCLRG